MVYRGTRLVVPENMVDEICEALHGAHQAAKAMKERHRDILYWPGMAENNQKTAEPWRPCQLNISKKHRESIRLHEVLSKPFAKVGTNVLCHRGKPHWFGVDYMSDYNETGR